MLGWRRAIVPWSSPHTMPTPAGPPTTPTCIYVTYVCIQAGKTALELAGDWYYKSINGKVVGVLIGAGMAAGKGVNARLGSVICVCVCMGAWVLLEVYVGSEGGL